MAEASPALARLVEGHLDALAILAELEATAPAEARLGVWAAEPAGLVVRAHRVTGGWRLEGTKPYASGADHLTHALVTAHAGNDRLLFLVPRERWTVERGTWRAVGMAGSESPTVTLDAEVAEDALVGGDGAYLRRPGFWHGGVGVAAVWYGGAVGVTRAAAGRGALRRPLPSRARALRRHRGGAACGGLLLADAAAAIDADPLDARQAAQLRARTVRARIEQVAAEALDRVGRALGAGRSATIAPTPAGSRISRCTSGRARGGRPGGDRPAGGGRWRMTSDAADRGAFERMYDDGDDPWGFTTSPYEARKRHITLASLPRSRYRSAFEPGCASGVLSADLAERCDALLACDVAGRAVRLAELRLGPNRAVRVERREIPRDWPAETFDLIVLSELAYFLQPAELERTMALIAAALEPGGDLVAVDWLGPIDGYPLDGEAVHARLAASPWRRVVEHASRSSCWRCTGVIRALDVVVPVHDEETQLGACLRALARSARHPLLAGIDVRLAGRPRRLLRPQRRGRRGGAARGPRRHAGRMPGAVGRRRRGVGAEALRRAASGCAPEQVWVATTDADTRVPPDWLVRHVRAADGGADALAGVVEVADWHEQPAHVRQVFERWYRAAARARSSATCTVRISASARRRSRQWAACRRWRWPRTTPWSTGWRRSTRRSCAPPPSGW